MSIKNLWLLIFFNGAYASDVFESYNLQVQTLGYGDNYELSFVDHEGIKKITMQYKLEPPFINLINFEIYIEDEILKINHGKKAIETLKGFCDDNHQLNIINSSGDQYSKELYKKCLEVEEYFQRLSLT